MAHSDTDPVTEDDIRTALGDLDSSSIDAETITQAIDLAEQIVDIEATDQATPAAKHMAVIDVAKYRVVTTNREAFINSVGSSTDDTGFNVQAKIRNLRRDKEDSMKRVRTARLGAATIGDRGQKSGGNHHYRGDKRRWF